MTAHETSQLEAIHADVKDIKLILLGNGKPEKGVVFRLALLEGKARRATWLITTVIGAILAAGFEFAFGVLRHR